MKGWTQQMEPKLSDEYIAADIESMTDEEFQDTLDRFEEEVRRFLKKDRDVEYSQNTLICSYEGGPSYSNEGGK